VTIILQISFSFTSKSVLHYSFGDDS